MEKTKERIEEIRERLEEYEKHESDSTTFFVVTMPYENKEIQELLNHAPADIEFLLNLIDSLTSQEREDEAVRKIKMNPGVMKIKLPTQKGSSTSLLIYYPIRHNSAMAEL